MSQPDLYISADIEADGPTPGRFSMLSFAFSVAARFDGRTFERLDPRAATFHRTLKPMSAQFDPASLAVTGLDREELTTSGADVVTALTEASHWVMDEAGGARPVFVGYPASFDWLFLAYYFHEFSEAGNPFMHSSVLDIKTMYATKARVTMSDAVRPAMPPGMVPSQHVLHDALADAIAQAELFCNVFEWEPPCGDQREPATAC